MFFMRWIISCTMTTDDADALPMLAIDFEPGVAGVPGVTPSIASALLLVPPLFGLFAGVLGAGWCVGAVLPSASILLYTSNSLTVSRRSSLSRWS